MAVSRVKRSASASVRMAATTKACQLLLLRSPDLFRSCLGLRQLHKSSPDPFLNRTSPLGGVPNGIHNFASEGRLPCRSELLVQTLSPGFSYANHVGVVFRKILISRQHSTSNAACGEIHNRSSHDVLDPGHMVGWNCGSLAHDGSQGAARERLELLVSKGRPVPFRCRLGDGLIGPAFEERLVDNGLAQGRLERRSSRAQCRLGCSIEMGCGMAT